MYKSRLDTEHNECIGLEQGCLDCMECSMDALIMECGYGTKNTSWLGFVQLCYKLIKIKSKSKSNPFFRRYIFDIFIFQNRPINQVVIVFLIHMITISTFCN